MLKWRRACGMVGRQVCSEMWWSDGGWQTAVDAEFITVCWLLACRGGCGAVCWLLVSHEVCDAV